MGRPSARALGPSMSSPEVALLVRALHVLAMATVLGGAVLLALLAWRTGPGGAGARGLLAGAVAYEWAFWGAFGVLVLTGIGNAGAFGAGLPGRGTPWGELFLAKLLVVAALLVGSMARTLVVALAAAAPEPPPRAARLLAAAYGATALVAALPAVLGVTLAHGGAA